MKVLITGASGFLGGWLTRRLVTEGLDVRVLCRPKSDLSAIKDLKFEKAIGDVTDPLSLEAATRGCESVFHVAAFIAYKPSDRKLMEKINVVGTQDLLNAAVKNGVKKIILTSSVAAVGGRLVPEILNEESAFGLEKYNLGYHKTKLASETILLGCAKRGDIESVILNPGVIFGPGDFLKATRKTHLKVAQGKIKFYPPGGCNIVDIEDVVEGHFRAFEKGKNGERYILGGDNVSLKDLFGTLAKFGGHPAPRVRLPEKALEGVYWLGRAASQLGIFKNLQSESALNGRLFHWYSSKKASLEFGIKFKSHEVAIGKSMDWCKEHGLL